MLRLFMLLLVLPMAVSAEIYRWVDDQGRVHFSDSDTEPEAEQVQVRVQTVKTVRVNYLPEWSSDLVPAAASVVMYSTPWCGVCKRAKGYFEEQGISFTEKDIEARPEWRAEFEQLGGKGVPLILVGERSMSGFSAGRFDALYQQEQAQR